MFQKWLDVSAVEVGGVVLSVAISYPLVLALTRLFGLRSFSKMTASDFAMTVAVGSLFGSSISGPEPSVGVAVVAFAGLFIGQYVLAWGRRRIPWVSRTIDNRPLLLMAGSEILHHNLRHANVTEDDLRAKLREANVLRLEQVRAVVFETTGDVSVLHADDDTELEPALLADVHDGERLADSR